MVQQRMQYVEQPVQYVEQPVHKPVMYTTMPVQRQQQVQYVAAMSPRPTQFVAAGQYGVPQYAAAMTPQFMPAPMSLPPTQVRVMRVYAYNACMRRYVCINMFACACIRINLCTYTRLSSMFLVYPRLPFIQPPCPCQPRRCV